MLTLQEIFNAAWEQAKLKKKSYDPESGRCLYRKYNEDGSCDKCFIGAIITDEQYESENLENQNGAVVLDTILKVLQHHCIYEDIRELQAIHDAYNVDEWHGKLLIYADDHGLVVPV